MILCLDVGNSQVYGGVYSQDRFILNFRRTSKTGASSDELGLFLKGVLRENGVDPDAISEIAICSVVPDIIHSLRNCCLKYFDITPFTFGPGVKTGLKIKYNNPTEVGADRIANAVAAIHQYPGRNLLIVDYGTATTFDAVSAKKEYLGGVITAGLRISMEALESRTAKLPNVEIVKPERVVGRTTVSAIQSGLFYGNLAMVKELKKQITSECFPGETVLTIGTGGFSRLFEESKVFDEIVPDLVLRGLVIAHKANRKTVEPTRSTLSAKAER